jgi:valyl-tRNA synthetase
MKTIMVPPVAATQNIHIGNLYTWFVADFLVRATEYFGDKAQCFQAWNCYSQKLEEKVGFDLPEDIVNACAESTEEAIKKAQSLFETYHLKIVSPYFKDNSIEFKNFLNEKISFLELNGRIKDSKINIPGSKEIYKKSESIIWVPSTVRNNIQGFASLEQPSQINLFRNGHWGIKHNQGVLGQRFVQAFFPNFYSNQLNSDINFCVCGKDIIGKWLYLVLSYNDYVPIKTIATHGMVLNSNGRKISKYDPLTTNLYDLDFNSDSIRLYFMNQKFGNDFLYPSDLKEEDRFLRKIHHSLSFLVNVPTKVGVASLQQDLIILKSSSDDIVHKILNFEFSKAYRSFKQLFYSQISRGLINQIKSKGITTKNKSGLLKELGSLVKVFCPDVVSSDSNFYHLVN